MSVYISLFTVLQKFLRNTKECHHLSCFSFKTVPFCNYTLVAKTVKVLESFLETVLWKPFQLFRRILDCVSGITRAPFLPCCFQSREQVKISWSNVRRVWEMLQCCHIFLCWEIFGQYRQVCWSIVLKEKPTVSPPFFGAFSSSGVSRTTKDVSVHIFIHSFTQNLSSAGNFVNYVGQFLEIFEATTYFSFMTVMNAV